MLSYNRGREVNGFLFLGVLTEYSGQTGVIGKPSSPKELCKTVNRQVRAEIVFLFRHLRDFPVGKLWAFLTSFSIHLLMRNIDISRTYQEYQGRLS
jgi:hypothetical protein